MPMLDVPCSEQRGSETISCMLKSSRYCHPMAQRSVRNEISPIFSAALATLYVPLGNLSREKAKNGNSVGRELVAW
jgi:hypothetical protein